LEAKNKKIYFKRVFLKVQIISLPLSLFVQKVPAFNGNNAYVFDSTAIPGKAKDSIKTKNTS